MVVRKEITMKAKERHEIKTDPFLDTMLKIQEYITDNGKTIGLGLVAILVVLIGWILVGNFLNAAEDKASTELNLLLSDFTIFQNTTEVNEKLTTKLEEGFQGVIANHGSTSSANIARYYLGLMELKKGNQEKALSSFEEVRNSSNVTFASMAASNSGNIYLEKGDYAKAAETFKTIADKGKGNLPQAFFAYKAGQAFEKAGDKNNALLYYNKAKDSGELGLDATLVNKIERAIQEINQN